MRLHKLCAVAAATLAVAGQALAQTHTDDSRVKALKVERTANNLFVTMQLDASDLKLGADAEIIYTPAITRDGETLELPCVVVAGRNRHIRNLRHGKFAADATLSRAGKVIEYSAKAPYEAWMESARLTMAEELRGCGSQTVSTAVRNLAVIGFSPDRFAPEYVFITPEAELVKTREARGSAYINFEVNKIDINPRYRRNPEELQKIRGTIDIIRNDGDTRIVAVTIEGFASPEGPYAENERLAKGRTEALRNYVRGLYTFDPSIMRSSWVAENWAGLRKYVADSDLADKNSILAVIDAENLEPDAREWKLKNAYPEQYRFLLDNVYPALRNSDYTVEYVVRSYTDVEEIKAVMKRAPQKLSLHEMYAVAQSLETGSDEYREVFEVAVRMYPDDPAANLNAANIALGRNELDRAAGYLAKAGDTPEAAYARGILAAKSGDYDRAARAFGDAATRGVKQAADAAAQLRESGLAK